MISCSSCRWLLQTYMVTAMILVGNSLNYDICEKYATFGFKSKESCSDAAHILSESWQKALHESKDEIGIVSNKVTNKFKSMLANALRIGTQSGASQSGSHNVFSPKKKVTLKDVNQERGFDLTKAEITKFKLWDKGVIPYFIDEYSFDKVLRDRIRFILDEVNAATNLQFMEIPRPPDDNSVRYVFFINRRGALKCVDYTSEDFSNEGLQRVILGYDCINLNAGMASTILTLVGVPPQHNAPDRNKYIQIEYHNIIPEKNLLFKKLKNEDWLFHDLEYDFESASHYHYHKYSLEGRATILPKKFKVHTSKVGEDKTFSYSDIWKIKMLYNYVSRSPNDKMKECSQMFQPGRDFNKYKPFQGNVKPRNKPMKYTKHEKLLNNSTEDQNSVDKAVQLNYSNDYYYSIDYTSGEVETLELLEKPHKLSNHGVPMSAETKKRLKLKQIIQNESDFHTEERK